MKKKSTKIAVGILSAAMLMSILSACGKSTTTTDKTPTEASKKPITLKVYGAQGFPGQFTSGVQTDPVSKAITDKTGVSLDWDMNPSADKTNALIASGDLPDILVLSSTGINMESLVKSGALTDLSTLVDSNGSEIKKVASKALDFSKQNLSNKTNKLYYLPGRVTVGASSSLIYSPVVGLFMRWDYYKEIGSPTLNNYDDVITALSKIQKNHPKTADGKKTYGFSMWQDWGKWHYTVLSEVTRSVNGVPGAGAVNYVDYANNYAFVDGLKSDNSPLWVDGEMYNKAYRAGLIDPDSFTQAYAQATSKMDAGQVLCQVAQWLTDGPNATLVKTGTKDAGYVSIPLKGAAYSSANYNPVGLAEYWSISSKCKDPKRAMDVINYIYSAECSRNFLSGAKGDTWTADASGKATLTDKGIKLKSDANFMITSGARKFQNFPGIDNYSKDSTGQFIDLYSDPDVLAKTLTPLKQDWLKAYGTTSENDFWHKNGGIATNSTFGQLLPTAQDDIARLDAKIATYLQANLAKLVMAKSEADFASVKAQIIKDVTAMDGYQAYVDWAKKAVETGKAGIANYK